MFSRGETRFICRFLSYFFKFFLRGSLTFKLAVLVVSIVIHCDRGDCYEHFKKKSNSDEN